MNRLARRVNQCLLWVTLTAVVPLAYAAQYKGVGGQIEAYGTLTASYYASLKSTDVCSKYSGVSAEAKTVKDSYLKNNRHIYNRVSVRIEELAVANGGDAELKRLRGEIESARPQLDQGISAEIHKLASSERSCSQVLANLKSGSWDLEKRFSKEVALIMGSNSSAPLKPPLRGFMDGCIDGQKKVLAKQGKSYVGNEDIVQQYCYCMAPITLDITQTAEGRAKLLDGDPVIAKRLRKVEAICLDGIKNGRRYGPYELQN